MTTRRPARSTRSMNAQSGIALKHQPAHNTAPAGDQQFTDPRHVLDRFNALDGEFRQAVSSVQRLDSLVRDGEAALEQWRVGLEETQNHWQAELEETQQSMLRETQTAADRMAAIQTIVDERVAALDAIRRTASEVLAAHQQAITQLQETGERIQASADAQLESIRANIEDHLDLICGKVDEQLNRARAEVDELRQAHQAWRAETESETQRRWQVEQLRADQWRARLSQDMTERADAITHLAQSTEEMMREHSRNLEQLSQRQQAEDLAIHNELVAFRAASDEKSRALEAEISAQREAIGFQQKLLYGLGGAIALVMLLCVIALFH